MLIDSEEAAIRSLELAYTVAKAILAPNTHSCKRVDCPICELIESVKNEVILASN